MDGISVQPTPFNTLHTFFAWTSLSSLYSSLPSFTQGLEVARRDPAFERYWSDLVTPEKSLTETLGEENPLPNEMDIHIIG